MIKQSIKLCFRFYLMLLVTFAIQISAHAEKVGIFYDKTVEPIKFAAFEVQKALVSKGFSVEMLSISSLKKNYTNKKIVITISKNKVTSKILSANGITLLSGLGEQSYTLRTTSKPQTSYWVIGGDINGAMYGGLQIAENILYDGFGTTYTETVTPDFKERGVKLNLPMDRRIPTYSGHTNNTSTQYAVKNVWDMKFWETWLDEQARNRYNVLSVWVHHPFPALVKVPGYEKACLPSIEGFFGYEDKTLTLEKRIAFWRQVMTYAHNRGFSFYFFCWNVCTEYADEMYPGVITEEENNPITQDYLSKSITELLKTYPELDGFGISAGDNMKSPKNDRPAWTWKAYGKAAYDYAIANPKRKFTIIHRGLGTALTSVYKDWDPLTKLPNFKFDYEVKYANAHMYSTLTPKWYDSDLSDGAKAGQKTWLTLRNDDYFFMDMGDPEFVRGYLKNIPYRNTINSFNIGADIYMPTRTYWCKDSTMNGQLEIQRNWYIQMLWGRTAYNKNISDQVFKKQMALRYPQVSSETMFKAWSLASRQLPKVQELTQGSWGLDAHWYAESSMYPQNRGAFRFLNDFIETKVAKSSSSNLCSISSSAAGTCGTAKSTYQLADEMEADGLNALSLIKGLNSSGNASLGVKLKDISQQGFLINHFAYKIRAATLKKANKIEEARQAMGKAYCWWMKYVNSMDAMYTGNKFRTVDIVPDWHYADKWQLKDYTDLGGIGIPDCE